MTSLYEEPVSFWKKVLGRDLHFHLGHFHQPDTSLDDSMLNAIHDLVEMIPFKRIDRVLDIGCGWGGPAFELAKTWGTQVLGLTISKRQTHFINGRAQTAHLPVQATTIDIENYNFDSIGTFNVLWLYEALEHIADRRTLLINLNRASSTNSLLAITVSCRSPTINREEIYSDILGVQPLESVSELLDLLAETGWNVLTVNDESESTLPVWRLWMNNLKRVDEQKYCELRNKLTVEFNELENLYGNGSLLSIQMVASQF